MLLVMKKIKRERERERRRNSDIAGRQARRQTGQRGRGKTNRQCYRQGH